MKHDHFTVLLAEDNLDHAELVIRSFEEQTFPCRIQHVIDGERALDYLFRRGRYADPETSPRPDVILLDLHMPRVDGHGVLEEIKTDPELRRIPTIVLTTSEAEMDLCKAYDRHANSYLVKPVDFERFASLMESLGFYWFIHNRPV